MRRPSLARGLGTAVTLLALAGAAAADMVRIGAQDPKTDDSKMERLHVAGAPDEREEIETRFGGRAGERWFYTFEDNYPDKIVIFTIRNGRIAAIEEGLLQCPEAGTARAAREPG